MGGGCGQRLPEKSKQFVFQEKRIEIRRRLIEILKLTTNDDPSDKFVNFDNKSPAQQTEILCSVMQWRNKRIGWEVNLDDLDKNPGQQAEILLLEHDIKNVFNYGKLYMNAKLRDRPYLWLCVIVYSSFYRVVVGDHIMTINP